MKAFCAVSPEEQSKTEIIQHFPLNLHNKAEILLPFRNKGGKKSKKEYPNKH